MANDLRTFNISCDDFARKVGIAPSTIVKRVAFDLFGRIVRKTPVDTGRARASWTISPNQADRSVLDAVRTTIKAGTTVTKTMRQRAVKAGINALQNQKLNALQITPGDTIVIANNVPYIGELEEGHSKQAPNGMVALSIAEVNTSMGRLMAEGVKDAGL